jgi:hypothetical protein
MSKRHLRAVESIDRGLREAEQITIEDGIHDAVLSGRMAPEVGAACLEAYRRTTTMSPAPDLPPALESTPLPEPPEAA